MLAESAELDGATARKFAAGLVICYALGIMQVAAPLNVGGAVLREPIRSMNKKQIALTAYVLSPVIVLVALCWTIAVSIQQPRKWNPPPVGAGAGDTGGANALGEWIAHGTLEKRSSGGGEGKGTAGLNGVEGVKATEGLIEPESLAQGVTLIVEDKSGKAGPSSPIYLACNYGGWNPADAAFKLEPQSDMRWRITVKRPVGSLERLEFKFTRGSWELEELNQDNSTVGNRTLPKIDDSEVKAGEPAKFEFVIPKWGDERPEYAAKAANDAYRPLKVTGDVRRLQVMGGAGVSPGQMRDLLVWLPPGYDDVKNAGVRYPVLYMQDGQNVFESGVGSPEEWNADEAATSLLGRKLISPLIVVAVPHSGAGRNSEYMPIAGIVGIPPRGAEHVAWLMNEVMPRAERALRIKTGPENTAVGGASLGAAISLYAATSHPERFGMVLAESLPLRTGDASAWSGYLSSVKVWPRKVYLGMGGAEMGSAAENGERNKGYVDAARDLDKQLDKAGLGPDRRLLVVESGAEHNEQAWAKRFPQALTFLFPPTMDATK